MDKQARIERISLMEDRYDELTRVLAGLEEAVGEYEDFKDELEVLRDYMDSGEWKEDYEADEAGQLNRVAKMAPYRFFIFIPCYCLLWRNSQSRTAAIL